MKNEKKKAYVVVDSWQLDDESGEEVIVFDNNLDATTEAFRRRNEAREAFNHMDCEEDESENSWAIYEQGNYMVNREVVTVYEREIN